MLHLNRFLCLTAAVITLSSPSVAEEWRPLLDLELSNFETFIGVPHTSVKGLPEGTFQAEKPTRGTPMGLDADVKKVFTVSEVDGEPVLKVSGEIYGGLTTLEEFDNFHFSTQFKWGEKKWEPRLEDRRDSGILYHCTGKHGRFWSVWKSSIEYQVQEKDLGDLYPLGGTSADVRATKRKYDPESEEYRSKGVVYAGAEPDAPHGQWNHLEIYTVGSTSVHIANGVVLMVLENMKLRGEPLSRGQIQIQSEAAECYYKEMQIQPITDFPAEIKAQMPSKPLEMATPQ